MSESISLTDTAKIMRAELKKEFPGVQFSVRSKGYSMGCSITVSWADGPDSSAVDNIVKQFEGASFDGMVDLKSYHDSTWQGKSVSWGPDYVFTQRTITNFEERQALALEMILMNCHLDSDGRFGNEWPDQLARQMVHHQDYYRKETLADVFQRIVLHRQLCAEV
jgi:hypothetical protein